MDGLYAAPDSGLLLTTCLLAYTRFLLRPQLMTRI